MGHAITVQNLSKTYRIYGSPYGRVWESLPWNKKIHHRPVHALCDINFEVQPGTCTGLIGGNGAGKSTLLKILTGTTFPTSGSYTLHGRVASLLELGAGFHMEFTGRENIYMNAAMMGFSRKETERRYQEILDFSELHEFIDAPLRTYSSGMICRLGFSVAVAVDPDVLIIDEILSVGDMHFQKKCVERILDYKERGKTMFFCSHSLYDVRQICTEAIWIKQGRIEEMGDAVTVTNEFATYQNQLSEATEHPDEVGDVRPDLPHIRHARLFDPATGEDRHEFSPHDTVGVQIQVRNGAERYKLTVGAAFIYSDRTILCAASTEMDGIPIDFDEGVVTLLLPSVKLLSGVFTVMVAVLDEHGVHRYHQMPVPQTLLIRNRTKDLGLFLHDHEWRVEPMVSHGGAGTPEKTA